uniref:Uncharacterized protein LOC111107493 isoform X3 n=1 Tax=Crassostrea virginica TaxID=6565 RepID=A0A8B8B4T0_CRAVI|nr:uncharacterized protein LOC111107493 isoform X3 [Crassostrea virginica]
MNALFVFSTIAASFIAGVYCGDYSTHGYSEHGGSIHGGGGYHGGHGYGPYGGGGPHHGGHGYGPIGGGGGPHHGGPGGGSVRGYLKSGTCPPSSESDSLQMGPHCSNDEQCHGVHKCCPNVYYGNRCQIPVEYQRPGNCNENYVYDPPYYTRRACNHDHTCPYNGKCCRRRSSGQIDTCTYPFYIGGPYPGTPGGPGNPGGPGRPGIPYPPVTGPGPVYPPKSKVY